MSSRDLAAVSSLTLISRRVAGLGKPVFVGRLWGVSADAEVPMAAVRIRPSAGQVRGGHA